MSTPFSVIMCQGREEEDMYEHVACDGQACDGSIMPSEYSRVHYAAGGTWAMPTYHTSAVLQVTGCPEGEASGPLTWVPELRYIEPSRKVQVSE